MQHRTADLRGYDGCKVNQTVGPPAIHACLANFVPGGLNTCCATVAGAEREAIVAGQQESQGSWHVIHRRTLRMALPNPSFEARPNGKPPGPPAGFVYHPAAGPVVLPSVPPQLER